MSTVYPQALKAAKAAFEFIQRFRVVILLCLTLTLAMQFSKKGPGWEVADEQNRGAVNFLFSKTKGPENRQLILLDLHTPETFDPSPDRFASRYSQYRLAQTLPFFCELGVHTIVLDFYLDNESWIGRHLSDSPDALKELSESLTCFKQVLLPIRQRQNPESGFNHIFKPDARFRLVHMNHFASVVYPAYVRILDASGWLTVPHAAEALRHNGAKNDYVAGSSEVTQEIHYPSSLRYHPQSWPLFGFEEITLITAMRGLSQPPSAQDLFRQLYADAAEPSVLLVGFSHDSTDLHNVAFNLGGKVRIRPGGSDLRQLEWPLTPGLFILASELGTVLADEQRRFVAYAPVGAFLWLFAILSIAQLMLERAGVSITRSMLLILGYGLGFWVFNQFLALVPGFHLPLNAPLLGLFLMFWADIAFRQGRLNQLLKAALKRDKPLSGPQSTQLLAAQPITLVLASQATQSQSDPYKRFLCELDLATFWIQYLGLLALADYSAHRQRRRKVVKEQSLQSFYRPTLGNYVHGLAGLYRQLPPSAAQPCSLPLLAQQAQDHRTGSLMESLQKILDLRNDWKHFASTHYAQSSIQQAEEELLRAYLQMLPKVHFLKDYRLIKAISPVARGNTDTDKPASWEVLCVSGTYARLERLRDIGDLQPQALYLVQEVEQEVAEVVLRLDPWLHAEECAYHHRVEVFFHAGLEWSRQDGLTGNINFNGLTESCKPISPVRAPEWAIKDMVKLPAPKK